jgi:hypothetical protein
MSVPLRTETVTVEGATATTPLEVARWLVLASVALLLEAWLLLEEDLPPPVRAITPTTTAATATAPSSTPKTTRPRERRGAERVGAPDGREDPAYLG